LQLIDHAITLMGEELVAAHISSASTGGVTLQNCREEQSPTVRLVLGKAAQSRQNAWFKSVGKMERIARDIVGPALSSGDPEFAGLLTALFGWITNVSEGN
jgi:putative ATP-dependent endonuclease of OLD family